jgi:hypothetical protein
LPGSATHIFPQSARKHYFYPNLQPKPPDLPVVISNRGRKTLNLRLRRNALGAPFPQPVLAKYSRLAKTVFSPSNRAVFRWKPV